MGCGESKHAIATENTLTKSKSKNLENNYGNVKANDFQDSGNENVKKNELPDGIKPGKETENAEEVKEIFKKTDEKDGGKKVFVDEKGNGESVIEGKLEDAVSVEEKKEENKNEKLEGEIKENGAKDETYGSVISEGCSGKPGKDSPYVSEGKVEANDAAEGKEKDGENEKNEDEEEAIKVDEGKPAEKTRSSGEEKTAADQKEKASAAAPTADEKTN